MPEYAPDLVELLENLHRGELQVSDILADRNLLERCLKSDSPYGLVASVSQENGVDNLPESLTAYERARILTALGQNEEAIVLYKQALQTGENDVMNGRILINLAAITEDAVEKEALFLQAVDIYAEAHEAYARFLFKEGKIREACDQVFIGIEAGHDLAIPTATEFLVQLLPHPEQLVYHLKLILESGIELDQNSIESAVRNQRVRPDLDGKIQPISINTNNEAVSEFNELIADENGQLPLTIGEDGAQYILDLVQAAMNVRSSNAA